MIDVDYNEYKATLEENMQLIQENHKLKERINDAIKYINRNTINSDFYEAFDGNIDDLLEILKGE